MQSQPIAPTIVDTQFAPSPELVAKIAKQFVRQPLQPSAPTARTLATRVAYLEERAEEQHNSIQFAESRAAIFDVHLGRIDDDLDALSGEWVSTSMVTAVTAGLSFAALLIALATISELLDGPTTVALLLGASFVVGFSAAAYFIPSVFSRTDGELHK